METKGKYENLENTIFDRDRAATIFYFGDLTTIVLKNINRFSQIIRNPHRHYIRKRSIMEEYP